ncbi:hypothetical protein MNBD_ACTINO02-2486 [hydrothermal vent metagenome]|uniref:Uncharacterized protein n=1 Tax=hydrothermal vent metagenome TaxID=652676 RepID=A0A3B0SY88_9ZZZZ
MPVVDKVAADFQGQVDFIAIAGWADINTTAAAAEQLFSSNLQWGLDEQIWGDFGIIGQPTVILFTPGGAEWKRWAGAVGEAGTRQALQDLVAASG